MQQKLTYSEKLKDPRWQKKRLQILERDNWCCQKCYGSDETLHVHHRFYRNCDPWDYPDEALLTLCVTCHDEEKEFRPENESDLIKILKHKTLSTHINDLCQGFIDMPLKYGVNADVMISAISWAISNEDILYKIEEAYMEYCKEKARNGKSST